MFNYFLATTRLPYDLAEWVAALPINRYGIIAVIALIYVVLGCFMATIPMIILTVPIFFPVAMSLGFDGIWFGVIVCRITEVALITPPYAMNLFVIQRAANVPIGTLYRGILPFCLSTLVIVALLVAFPELTTWLPSVMR